MSILPPAVIQALQEAELIHKRDRLCDLAAIDAIPIELSQILTLSNQISIAKQSTTAERILIELANNKHKEVLFAILKNPSFTFKIVEILIGHEDHQVRALAKARPKDTTAPNSWGNPEYLRKMSQDKQGMVRCQVAGNTATPVDVLALLADDPYDGITDGRNDSKLVRAAVAGNPSTPIAILRKLSRDPSCLTSIARNPNTPVDILEELAKTNDRSLFYGMTFNPCTPGHILAKIAFLYPNDIDFMIGTISKHPNTPDATLSILSTYTDNNTCSVRVGVASNTSTPPDILVNLAADSYIVRGYDCYDRFAIKIAVASNPKTPSHTLKLLWSSKDVFICQALAKNPAISTELLRNIAESGEYTIQSHSFGDYSKIKSELISTLNNQKYLLKDIQVALCSNIQTPSDILEKLAHDRSCDRVSIAKHQNTPISVLEKLSQLKASSKVRITAQARLRAIYRELAANPETSTEQLWEMLYHRDIEIRLAVMLHPHGLNLLLDRVLQLENSLNRFIAGLHPQLSALQRDKLFYSDNWLDRLAIACNPSTLIEQLQILSQDDRGLIRDIASQKILD